MTKHIWLRCCLLAVVFLLAACSEEQPPASPTDHVTAEPMATLAATPTLGEAEAGDVRVSVSFEREAASPGESVWAEVTATYVDDLYGAEIHLVYDADLLEVVDADAVTEGVQAADGELLSVEFTVRNQADNSAGTLAYAVSQMPPSSGAAGAGTLTRIQFRAKGAGRASVAITEVVLASSAGHAIPASADPAAAQLEIK